MVSDLHPDDRAQLLDELPAGVAFRLLSRLPAHERQMTVGLLGYPEESVGRRIAPSIPLLIGTGGNVGDQVAAVRRRAGDGNRTRTTSLEDWGSTIELHPHAGRPYALGERLLYFLGAVAEAAGRAGYGAAW